MKIAIIINSQRLTDSLSNTLNKQELTEKYNITYDVFILNPPEINDQLKNINYKSYNAILIGGGDGTVRVIVQALIDEDVPIAILPLGSFNLLARDLGYSNDIDSMFNIIKNNKTKQIDLAEVNDHIIINHSWIGFYYYILKFRKKYKKVLGRSKLLKILFNTINIFNVLPIYKLNFIIDDKEVSYKTCLVYISNNESNANIKGFAERQHLSAGLIWVTILNCHTRWTLFKCLLIALLKGMKNSKYITYFNCDKLVITTEKKSIDIIIDGDAFKLDTPLTYTIHQKKLTVIIP